ncbi:MAG TPA: hypothetical protein VKE69_13525, partial [Planctomycetota bacterium]|nr:hypothetical protein [Planctomycetota bacterium]
MSSTPVASSVPLSRRDLLSTGGSIALAARLGALGAASALLGSRAAADEIGPLLGPERVRAALRLRIAAAQAQASQALPGHPDNGDEAAYSDRRGSFSKGLPHDGLGEVSASAYSALLAALTSGEAADFESIPMGSSPTVKLTSPMAAYAFEMNGPDGHHTFVPAAPAFASARRAAEAIEVYWQAITRDVPFSDYATSPLVAEACADLSALSDYAGPKVGGVVTPATIFRHSQQIGLVGPYLSQFLWKPVAIGSLRLEQKYVVPVAGQKYGTSYASWLAIQNGVPQAPTPVLSGTPRYLITAHDLGESVHN